jgi:4-amino-4-deoxy-L-arabinose transferase-like glycosyltransferase
MRVQSPWMMRVAMLLILWATRVTSLESLPLHNDEGLHLTRAVEVWNGHPFWDISDGKIVYHWLIAVFYPHNAPDLIGRIATVFVSMIGIAAAYALARRAFGEWSAFFAAALWIGSPYLFFYERLAFSDAEAGALVVLTAWLCVRLARSGRARDAVLAGLALGAAVLFKFTAAPFALMAGLIVFALSRHPRKLVHIGFMAVTAAACFIPPLAYIALRGKDFFAVALNWIVGSGSSEQGFAFAANLARLSAQLTGYGTLGWTALLLGGLMCLVVLSRVGRVLLLVSTVPLLIMLVLGREVLPRHYVVVLPIALTLAGAGLGLLVQRLAETRERASVAGLALAVLTLGLWPFIQTAYTDPGAVTLPQEDVRQFIIDHSSGFGLREAVRDFPNTIENGLPVIGSMFPDGCKRANFYAVDNLHMICTEAPGLPRIEAALQELGAVYVLTDSAPLIGVDVQSLDVQATQIAVYPRPGEADANASVVLWLLRQP